MNRVSYPGSEPEAQISSHRPKGGLPLRPFSTNGTLDQPMERANNLLSRILHHRRKPYASLVEGGVKGGGSRDDVSSDDHADEGEMKEAVAAVPSISLDDLTKVIVQKIKQNRSNNAKIGSILKTYGVAKVSELPAEKYEAFLTDLSQI